MLGTRSTALSIIFRTAKTRASVFAKASRHSFSTSTPQPQPQLHPQTPLLIPRMTHQQPQPSFSTPDPNAPVPLDFYRAHISDILARITHLNAADIIRAVQRPQTLDKGDCILAAPALRIKGKKPDEVAKTISNEFPETPYVEKPIAVGTFIQFYFKTPALAKLVLPTILSLGSKYGCDYSIGLKDPTNPSRGRKKVVVEFGSPNIAKPFHAGHLRSTIIGGFIANIYEQLGWDVLRINYLGDWGKQYGVLAVGFNDFGSDQALAENPTSHLFDVYVKISAIGREEQDTIKEKQAQIAVLKQTNRPTEELDTEIRKIEAKSVDERARQYFKRMCDGEPEALQLWKKFRDLSIVKYEQTFARLNIHFDEYLGESQISDASMERAEEILNKKGITEESQGARIVDLTKYSKSLGKAIVRKKDGTSIYLTRDIGGVFERAEKYNFDKMVYVIANQQDLHMAQLIKIIEIMDRKDLAEKLQHINFGLVHGMSTRRGTVKFLDDILRDTAEKMHEVMKTNQAKYLQVENPDKTADILGISAVLVQDMSGKRINGYTFDMDRMTSFEGDTGPYLQYAHARLCSIIRKAEVSQEELEGADLTLLKEAHATELLRVLAQWPDIIQQSFKTQEPVTVLTYLFKMTHVLSSSYDHLNILKSETELKLARLTLYTCARQVLHNGMRILGLTPVERM